VAGLEALELADQAVAQQVEVADGIEDLVLDEFVFVAKAVFVEYAISSTTMAFSTLPPSARLCLRRYSMSRMKPKVRARLTSFTNEVLEKSTLALWVG
jgi:hypothetical protein